MADHRNEVITLTTIYVASSSLALLLAVAALVREVRCVVPCRFCSVKSSPAGDRMFPRSLHIHCMTSDDRHGPDVDRLQ